MTKWMRVVLDEGKARILSSLEADDKPCEAHIIRNRSSQIFAAVYNLSSLYRWCVTGTPIQNSIEDLGSLVGFLRAQPYDDSKFFTTTFSRPIRSGNDYGWERLRALIRGISLRRTKASLAAEISLPPRHEIVEYVQLSEDERKLYDLLLQHFSAARVSPGSSTGTFYLITRLRQICDYGPDLLPEPLVQWLQTASSLNVTLSPPLLRCCDACGEGLQENEKLECGGPLCLHQVCGRCCLKSKDIEQHPNCPLCPKDDSTNSQGQVGLVSSTRSSILPSDYSASSKVRALLKHLLRDASQSAGSKNPVEKR